MKSRIPSQVKRRRAAAALPLPKAQRGSAAAFAAVAVVAMLLSTLLSINIGRIYYAQRDLQKLANMGALAAVEAGSGCAPGATSRNTAAAQARVLAILQANLPGESSSQVAGLLTTINGISGVQLGMETTNGVNPTSGKTDNLYHFVALKDGNPAIDAAVVNLTTTSPSLIGAAFFPGFSPVSLNASATAMQRPLGAFTIGSTLANLNTQNSALLNPLLSALLGTSLNLSAVDYTNMASVQLSLANLEVAAGVNDLNSLLALNTNLAGVQQLLAAATAQVNPSVANLVTGLTLGTAQAGQNVPLAQLLGNVAEGLNPAVTDVASLVPSLDLLDLLQQAGEAAAGNSPNSFLTLQGTPSVPGLISNYVFVSIQQPPQTSGYGPVGSTAQTAQITVHLRTSVDTSATGIVGAVLGLLNGLLTLLGGITISPINLGLDLYIANATATLDSLTCPTAATPHPTATIGVNSHLATLYLGTFVGNAQNNPALATTSANFLQIQGTGLLGLISATLGLQTGSVGPAYVGNTTGATAGPFTVYGTPYQPSATTSPQTYIYAACNDTVANPPSCGSTTDPTNPANPIPTGDIVSGISNLLGQLFNNNNLIVNVAGIPLGAILDPLISALNTLLVAPLSALVDAILDPLLQLLGVQIASATVMMTGVETGQQTIVNNNLPGSSSF
jgi:uncharacterized membrane protein